MSKFCGNCGAQLDDSAKICGYCGTPLSGQATNKTSSIPGVVNKASQEKMANTTALIKKGIIGIVAVVVLILVLNVVSSFTGYKGVVRKVVNAFEDYDMKTLTACASDLNYYNDYTDWDDVFEYRVSSKLDYYEDMLGHNLKISYKILDSYKMDDRNKNALIERYENEGVDVDKVKTVRVVELELKIKGSKSTSTFTKDNMVLIKEGGKWKVLNTDY